MAQRSLSIDLEDIRPRTREMLPWTTEQLVSLVASNAVGLTLAAVGWWQTLTRDESASQQFGWLNLAILGLLIAGCANVLWLARGRRTVTLAKTAVLPHSWIRDGASVGSAATTGVWTAVPGIPAPMPSSNGARKPAMSRTGACVASETMSRYHRPSCILVAGKDAFAADPASHADAGRRPCEICQP